MTSTGVRESTEAHASVGTRSGRRLMNNWGTSKARRRDSNAFSLRLKSSPKAKADLAWRVILMHASKAGNVDRATWAARQLLKSGTSTKFQENVHGRISWYFRRT